MAGGRPERSSFGPAGVSTRYARPSLRCGPSGDTPSVPPLKQQIWALRPGLDGGVPALHDNTKKREGWRFGDKRWLIAPTATSKLGAGRARPLGGAKGLSGAACGVSLGGSG